MMKQMKYIIICLSLLLFTGCSMNQESKKTEQANQVTIYEKNDIKIELSGEYNPASTDRNYHILFTNNTEEITSINLKNVVVNDTLLSADISMIADVGEVRSSDLEDLSDDMQKMEMDAIENISFSLEINNNSEEAENVTMKIPGGLSFSPHGNNTISSAIESQSIIDTEELRLSTEYCGDIYTQTNRLYFVLKAENRTNQSIPIDVNSVRINERDVEAYARDAAFPGNTSGFLDFNLNLEDAGVNRADDIYRIDFLISTSYSEKNGGGEWYTVYSAEGKEEQINTADYTLLDSYDGVSVYLVNYTEEEYLEDEIKSYWNVFITNDGSENVELVLTNKKVNGQELEEDEAYSLKWESFAYPKIGTGGKAENTIQYRRKKTDSLESISFVIEYYKNGQNELLHRGKEITLEAK